MPTNIITCCIVGCQVTGVHQHRFPNPEKDLDRFNTWLRILNMEELRSLSSATVYVNKRICSAHFESKYKSPGNPRLHRNALPSLEIIESSSASSTDPSGVSAISMELDHTLVDVARAIVKRIMFILNYYDVDVDKFQLLCKKSMKVL